jgi:hypothetical protein
MSESLEPRAELMELLAAMRDGELTEAQTALLEHLLRDDPRNQRDYVDYVALCVSLRDHQLAESAEQPATDTAGGIGTRGGWSRMLMAAGLMLAAAAGLSLLVRSGEWTEPTSAAGVAVLTAAADAQWDEGSLLPTAGSTIPAGKLKLRAGLVQIEFYCGATVILQGPAEFDVMAVDRGYIHRGRIRAHVPPAAQGFSVGSKSMNVVDLGTEFGLSVDEQGRPEVHVFDGKVELHDNTGAPTATLESGKAIGIDDAGAPRAIQADPAAFADPARLSLLSGAAMRSGRDRWLHYAGRLAADPSLLIHYAMTDRGGWDRALTNGGAAGSPLDGAIVGCAWAEGRWPGKYALEYKRTGDRVRLNLPGELQAMTLAAWVRFDGFDRQYNSLMLTDEWNTGNPHWQVARDGQIILGVGGVGNYTSPSALGQADLGKWMHLAVVYDPAAAQVTHYVNGRAVALLPIHKPVTLVVGTAELGNWGMPRGQGDSRVRNLNGRIDEFALFKRALTDAEVAAMHEAGRPQ